MNAPAVILPQFERAHRNDRDKEHAILFDAHGRLVANRAGDINSVSFTPQELDKACMGLLSHSHILGKPPSEDDLMLAANYGLTLRAIGTTPDGDSYEYTVQMPGPSSQVAEGIENAYDDEIRQARREMDGRGLNLWAWEREARHLAVSRLAQRYGFKYDRLQRNAPLSETTQHEARRLNVLTDIDRAVRDDVLVPLHAGIVKSLTRHADSRGQIDVMRIDAIRREVSGLVQRTFLGQPMQDGSLAPYTMRDGEVIPRSAFFRVLWAGMMTAATAAVERQASIMRKYLPEDLRRLFEHATINPWTGVHEITEYDPLHQWIGPDGKTLSDRIWNLAGDMGRKLDRYLAAAISSGRPAHQMARDLEMYLLPGRKSGGEFSYEALRLARTEIAAAHSRADSAAAQLNPFVESYSLVTAPTHACCDNCDEDEANSPYPKADISHLPPRHPNCICGIVWHLVSNIQAVIASIRDSVAEGLAKAKAAITDFINPLNVLRFVKLLFGGRQ